MASVSFALNEICEKQTQHKVKDKKFIIHPTEHKNL